MGMDAGMVMWLAVAGALFMLLLLACACWHLDAFSRKSQSSRQESLPEHLPPVTVVMLAHNQASSLQSSLPGFLCQDYPVRFEVMVVDLSSTDDTFGLLEDMETLYPHLHHTFVPSTARDVSLERLGLMLGIKAASFDHIVFTSPECTPVSPHWLRWMTAPFVRSGVQIVLGPTRYDCPSGLKSFFMNWQQTLWLLWATGHRPYCSGFANVGYHRSLFQQQQSFSSHAYLLAGAIDIMVNHSGRSGNTAVCLHPDANVSMAASRFSWPDYRLFYMETRRHFVHTFAYRLRYAFLSLLPWAALLCMAVAATVCVLGHGMLQASLLLAISLLGLVILYVCFFRLSRVWHFPGYRIFLPLEWLMVWPSDLKSFFRYCSTNRQFFRKKFI